MAVKYLNEDDMVRFLLNGTTLNSVKHDYKVARLFVRILPILLFWSLSLRLGFYIKDFSTPSSSVNLASIKR